MIHYPVNESSIHVKWDLSEKMDGIEVFVVKAIDIDDGERLCLADKFDTECTITGLSSSTTYIVKVKSCDGNKADNTVICSKDVRFYESTTGHSE